MAVTANFLARRPFEETASPLLLEAWSSVDEPNPGDHSINSKRPCRSRVHQCETTEA